MKSFTLSLATLLFSPLVLALEPNPVNAGPFEIIPTLSITSTKNDNIFFNQTTAQPPVESNILIINPTIVTNLEGSRSQYAFQFDIFDGRFSNSPVDDYTDWQIAGSAQYQMGTRHNLGLNTSLFRTQERRGTGLSEAGILPDEPDEYDDTEFRVNYQFGSAGSPGRITLDFNYLEREYTTARNEALSRNRETFGTGVTFAWNVSPRFDVLLDYRFRTTNYVEEDATVDSRDSEENTLMAGVELAATSTLSGSFRMGYSQRQYDAAQRESDSTPSWELDIQWSPLSYSTFNIGATSSFNEANLTGNSIQARAYNVGWQHAWTGRISSSVQAVHENDSFGAELRNDRTNQYTLSVIYAFARWLDLNLAFSTQERSSNIPDFGYEQTLFSIGIQASL